MPDDRNKPHQIYYDSHKDSFSTAHKKYMNQYVEIKARMTSEKREEVANHAKTITNESVSAFINRAIDETIKRDLKKKSK